MYVLSIAVIKYYSEHLWNPTATKKKIKPKGTAVHKLASPVNTSTRVYVYLCLTYTYMYSVHVYTCTYSIFFMPLVFPVDTVFLDICLYTCTN